MAEYTKKWLSLEQQLAKLVSRGVDVWDLIDGRDLLNRVGYYRLTGYLYPFRESEKYVDESGRHKVRVFNRYRAGSSLSEAAALVDFDRSLRMLVLDGIERIEISFRMQMGYVLGRRSAFAHADPTYFVTSFTHPEKNVETGETGLSKHQQWLDHVKAREASSDEAFVAHFRGKYDGQMPIWALTEILELGQLNRLYAGLNSSIATEIADQYGAPSKKVMVSWLASLNYVRNVSAHHARLFNRKLVSAPARPKSAEVPLLGHLSEASTAKQVFGVYNALAVMAYLLRSIEPESGWIARMASLLKSFPESERLHISSIGVPAGWTSFELWQTPPG